MAANTAPVFVLTPVAAQANVAAANTNRDGTGTLVDLVTGGTDGTRIDRIVAKAAVTTTAGMLRIFHYDGTSNRLIDEIPVSAITPSASVESFSAELVRGDGLPYIVLKSGDKLKVTMHNAESMNVWAIGGSY